MKKFILFFTVFCFFNNSFPNELKYELIVDNLDVPWAFVFLPDDSILITERRGELIHYKNGVKTLIKNLPEPKEQNGEVKIFKRLSHKDNEISMDASFEEFYNKIRMLDDSSYPNAYLKLENTIIEFSEICFSRTVRKN